jgi:hypothetical protein
MSLCEVCFGSMALKNPERLRERRPRQDAAQDFPARLRGDQLFVSGAVI